MTDAVWRTNWSGTTAFGAERLHRPQSVEQVQETVAGAAHVRVIGSRHSFNAIADSAELMTLEALPADVRVDREAGTVSFAARLRYRDLIAVLNAESLALRNLASLPHITVAGAIATGTHGSGDANGSLATAVTGLEVVRADGEMLRVSRGDDEFEGMVVGLGAVGVVTRITLAVEPAFAVRQRVFEGLPWEALFEHFDEIMGGGYSVSVFSDWGERAGQVWIKTLVTDEPEVVAPDLFGAVASTRERHPDIRADPANSTLQLGVPGPWSERITHFRAELDPGSGNEAQAEYMVPRRHAVAAIQAVRTLSPRLNALIYASEFRSVAADSLWMSPEYGRETVCLHFTFQKRLDIVEPLLRDIERLLEPFEARPHWGKLFQARAEKIAPLYPRLPDFRHLVERIDPRGCFANDWLRTRVLGDG